MATTFSLWNPVTIGSIALDHRLAMAPMTRNRATPTGVPTAMNAAYYAQRASNSLIITEGTQPSPDGQGYLLTPGIYNDGHIDGWRRVTEAVHQAGGHIVIQLMHTGRVAHPTNTPHGRQPVAPSPIQPHATIHTTAGRQEIPEPRALSEQEIADTVQDFRHAAQAAIAAGADGVEIHGANGYLVHQFLSSNANQRADRYGGSITNRIRFAVEVAAGVADAIGSDRTGMRISPGASLNDIAEDDTPQLYASLVDALAPLNLAYLHVAHNGDEDVLRAIRRDWPGNLLLNRAGADIETRAADVEHGIADVITVGRMALANPDLVDRVRSGFDLNEPDPTTFYSGGEHGYTDYPALAGATLVGASHD